VSIPRIDIHTPLSLSLLAFGVVVAGAASDVPALVPFVRPAFIFFAVLGPLRWVGRSIATVPPQGGEQNGLVPLGDLLSKNRRRLLRFLIWGTQTILVLVGVGYLFVAIPAIAG
jgi:hypothetical protein